MGFSGGGSNILKPHKHNSLTLQDGGNLDFKNDTQSDMSAGSVTYSNGSHLQELVKPVTPADQVLTFATAGTAPTWGTDPFLERGKLEYLGKHENLLEEDTFTFTFPTPINFDNYAAILVYWHYDLDATATTFNTEVTLDANTTANYNLWGYDQAGTTLTGLQSLTQANWVIADTALNSGAHQMIFGEFKIVAHEDPLSSGDYYPAIVSNAWSYQLTTRQINGTKPQDMGTISSIEFTSSAGAGSGWESIQALFYGVRR